MRALYKHQIHQKYLQFFSHACIVSLHLKATIHQVTTMLATSKNVLHVCPGHNHLLYYAAHQGSGVFCE